MTVRLEVSGDAITLVADGVAITRVSRAISSSDLAALVALAEETVSLRAQVAGLMAQRAGAPHAACVAHDVNNALTAIMAIACVFESRSGTDDACLAKDIVAACVSAAEALATLVRPATTRRGGCTDVNAVVSKMERFLGRMLCGSAALALDLQPGLPPVSLDAGTLERALLNIVGNARDAIAEHGRVVIATRLARDGAVVLSVDDNGVGMDEATLRRAVEPFFTTKPPGKGTGLGLASVAAAVRAAGGSLDIASSPGAGTRVTLSFAPPRP